MEDEAVHRRMRAEQIAESRKPSFSSHIRPIVTLSAGQKAQIDGMCKQLERALNAVDQKPGG
ncbi:MAG: hypothetical protein ACOYOS_00215 [Syntrophales bacterium]